MLKSEEYISCNACHICDGELYEGWRVGCEDLVFRSGAEEALKVKEEEVRIEMKSKAIVAFKEKCPCWSRFSQDRKCDECAYLKDFCNQLD